MGEPEIPHLGLDGRLTSLVSPELVLHGTWSEGLAGKRVRVDGSFGPTSLMIVHAEGVSPTGDSDHFVIPQGKAPEERRFQLVLAARPVDPSRRSETDGGKAPQKHLGNTFPFETLPLTISFHCDDVPLRTTLRAELPNNVTRYTKDTLHLQHVFDEGKLVLSSRIGGQLVFPPNDQTRRAGDAPPEDEPFRIHLRYRPISALRRMASPILIAVSAALLNLAIILSEAEAVPGAWRSSPLVLFGLITVNASALGTIAALEGGGRTMTLLNGNRLVAWGFVVFLVSGIRNAGAPYASFIVDAFLKYSVVAVTVSAIYAFTAYAFMYDTASRQKWTLSLFAIGALSWIGALALPPALIAQEIAAVLSGGT